MVLQCPDIGTWGCKITPYKPFLIRESHYRDFASYRFYMKIALSLSVCYRLIFFLSFSIENHPKPNKDMPRLNLKPARSYYEIRHGALQ